MISGQASEARRGAARLGAAIGIVGWLVASLARAGETAVPATETAAFAAAADLFGSRCAMPACHSGPDARQGMRLDPDDIYRSIVNVPARTRRGMVRVAPGRPEESLLYLVLLPPGAPGARSPHMPKDGKPLTSEELDLVRGWILSFPTALWGPSAEPTAPIAEASRSFRDTTLLNLPTPETVGAGVTRFAFAHRFRESVVDAGSSDLYGIDGGAWISLQLDYGFGDRWEVGLAHTNLQKAEELSFKVRLLRQGTKSSPVDLSYRGAFSRLRDSGHENDSRLVGQLLLSRRFGERLSLLLAPTFSTHTNYLDGTDDRGTTAVGVGGELHLNPHLALSGEWIGQVWGVRAPFQSGSVGVSIGTSRHVFQILFTNTEGMHPDLYAPGGDLDFGDGRFRLGFNISRTWGGSG